MQRGGSKGRGRDERSFGDGPNGNGAARFEFTIPSEYRASQEVQDKIMHDVNRRGFNSQTVFAIKLALEEAMMNAIKHGNRRDEKKKVHVEAKVNSRQAEIVVEDEGPGFSRHVGARSDAAGKPGKMQREGNSFDRGVCARGGVEQGREAGEDDYSRWSGRVAEGINGVLTAGAGCNRVIGGRESTIMAGHADSAAH